MLSTMANHLPFFFVLAENNNNSNDVNLICIIKNQYNISLVENNWMVNDQRFVCNLIDNEGLQLKYARKPNVRSTRLILNLKFT